MLNASRSSAITQLLGLSCVLILASCDTGEPPAESGTVSTEATAAPDTGVVTADAGQGALLPEAGWSIEEGLTVELEFTGQYNAVTGELEFDFGDASVPVSENGLRTAGQALWCQDRITVVQDGVAGSNPPNTFEILSASVGTYAACDPSTFPDGTPSGLSYANLVDTDGALCSTITIRSFYPFAFQDVHAWIYEVNPIDNYAYTWGDRTIDGLGNGAEPPLGANAPSDNRGGLFFYGGVAARDPLGADNAVTQPWVFRYPIDGANFNFRGKLVARFSETCNSIDDDCDGRIDEGANCFAAGAVCVDSTDCAASSLGAPVSCVASASGSGTTCGGGILQENCSGTTDTNGDGRVGCLDPTCSGVGSCADSSCVQSNVGNDISSFEGDPVATGAVTATSVGTFSLPAGQERCSSRFEGAERTWVWTAPANGSYTFSTVGSSYDTALMVVRGECPVDLVAAFNAGSAFCSEGSVVGTQAEEVTLSMVAGETALVIVDSSYAPSLTIGRGNASLSIFKSAVCGDNFRDAQNRFGVAVEACDAGPVSTAACDGNCTSVVCGDLFLNLAVEGCEDGNVVAGDGCTPTCTIESGFSCPSGVDCVAVCGDGIVAGPEVCDDSNVVNTDGCSSDCRTQDSRWSCVPGACTPICGDGLTAGPEVCDSSGGIGCEVCLLVTPGYRCPQSGGACSDIDECGEGIDACSIFGLCQNLPGNYACSCDTGFSGDGFICSDVNECLTNNGGCDVNAACANNDGGRVCTCNTGWSGSGTTCSDVNECLTNNGGCDALTACSNSQGSYSCGACPAGYNGTGATSCTPNVCTSPLTPAFASRTDTATTYPLGTVIQLACNAGYEATGGNTSRTCSATGTTGPAVAFSGSDVVCSRIACDPVPALSNASLVGSGTGLLFGDTASYTCNAGYLVSGGTLEVSCGTDGSWTTPAGTCAPRDCGGLGAPTNGSVVAPVTTFGASATYSCNSGYTAAGATSRTCGADGTWSGVAPTCTINACTPPTAPVGAALSGGPYTYTFGETLTYACDVGRTATGPLTQTCQANSTYTSVANSCNLVDCGTLAAPSNGTISAGATTFGTTRTLGCDVGYVVGGSQSRSCQADGSWSGTVTTCTIFDCGAAPSPSNATISGQTGTTFGSTVTYACSSGYERTAGSASLSCGASGWTGTPPTCTRVACPTVPTISNATLSDAPGTYSFTDVATYACNSGYELSGAATLTATCGASGSFGAASGTCVRRDCGSLTSPTSGAVSFTTTTFESTASYTCDVGYTLTGSNSRSCQADGSWSGAAPTCEIVGCPAPVGPTGSILTGGPYSFTYNESVTFACETGRTATGPIQLTCQANGTYSTSANSCPLVDCGTLSTPTNGTISAGATTYNTTRTLGCNVGYNVSGSTSRTCQASGLWSGSPTVCTINDCGAPPVPVNGTVSATTGNTFGSTVTYACNSGYTGASGTPALTCGAAGWQGTVPTCERVTCPSVTSGAEAPANASITAGGPGPHVFEDSVTFACNTGYELTAGNASRTCQADATWTGTRPTCTAITCTDPGVPVGGFIVAGSAAGPAPFAFGAVINYDCDDDRTPVGSQTLTCGTGTAPNGRWDFPRPTCAANDCGPLPAVANSTLSPPSPATTSGSSVTYTCNSGYTQTSGTLNRTCNGTTRLWSGTSPVCSPVSCGSRTTPAGQVLTGGPYSNVFGETLTYSCAPGWELPSGATTGDLSSACQAAGTWATPAAACQRVSCGSLTAPTNGSQSGSGTTFEAVRTFACGSGYVLGGSASRTCQADGTWSGTVATCAPVDCGALTNPAQGSVSAPVTTLGNTATYACSPGYLLTGNSGSATRTCQAAGSWSGTAPTCAPRDCGALTNPTNGTVSAPVTTYTSTPTTATYSCNAGYELVGSATRACQTSGTWSGAAATCQIRDCNAPSAVSNGGVSAPVTTFGATATHSCSAGYSVRSGTSTTQTCSAAGTWSWTGTALVCDIQSCGTPPDVTNDGASSPSFTTTTFGSSATYTCASGYVLSGTAAITCNASGGTVAWSTAPTCQPVNCGNTLPANPSNATFTSLSGFTFGNTATYGCASGYTATGIAGGATTTTSTCQAGATWSTPAGCLPVSCGAVPGAGSNSSATSNTGTTFNATATYTCTTPGYTTTGVAGGGTTYTRTCGSSGTWGAVTGNCQPVTCGTVPAAGVFSSATSNTGTTFGSTATYTCTSPGYSTTGVAGGPTTYTATCQSSGSWSALSGTCAAVTCGSLSNPTNGTVSTPSTSFNGTATYSCSVGYILTGTTTRTCQSSGAWSGTAPTCVPRDCGTPPVIANDATSSPSFTATTFPSSATYTCDTGYTGGGTINCQSSGSWQAAPACTPVSCGTAPATITNGTRTSTAGTTFGLTATYTCSAGFDNDGAPGGTATATLTCQAGGTWGAQSGSCVQISCGTAPAIGANNSAPAGTYIAGASATYTCSTGFSIDGGNTSVQTFTRTCNASTGWSTPADSTCDAFQCPTVSNVVDGPSGLNAAVVSYPDTTRFYNQRLQYTRQEGFTQTGGDSLRTCGANGQWSGVAPTFSRMSCPAIPTPATPSQLTVTYRNLSSVVTTDRFVNHTAGFGCGSGFSASPATVQTCRETSATSVQWQTTPGVAASNPVCADVNECTSGSPPNCGSNATCNNTSGSYQCVCNTASGFVGTTTTGGPATCATSCGDGIRAGAEVCDDGAWNDRPALGQVNPVAAHPRYGATDCEGRACDCTTNSFPTANYPGCTPRTVCLQASSQVCTAVNPVTPARCSDGVSNDADGLIDCFDPECSDKANCPNWSSSTCAIQNYLGSRINTPSTTAVGNYTLALTDPNNWNVSTDGALRGSTDQAFAWQAPLTGTYRFTTCGATFDSVIGVFSGVRCSETANPPTHLASNDDTCLDDAQVDVAVTQGQWYTIVVTGFNGGATGTFPLNITAVTTQVCGDGIVNGFTSVGVNNAVAIPDSRMTGSANFAGGEPRLGRLLGTAAFASSAGCNDSSWLQVDLGGPSPTQGVLTQGNGNTGFNEYVTSYRVRYSNDATNWTEVGGTTANTGTLFRGNSDRGATRVNTWAPITARYWRVHPISCYNGGTPAMRIDFIGSLEECDDGNAVNTDTCSNTCRINSDPFPTCAPTVQSNVVNQLGSTGSVGTANLLSSCPAGMVAAGLYGRADSNIVSRFGARCAPLLVNSSATAVVSRGTPQDAASLGRTTGTNSAQDCPANQFLIGVNFRSGGLIDSYQGICGSFTYSNSNRTITRTTNFTTSTIGGSGGGAVQYLCPDNQVVTGVNAGSDGNFVTRAGITCAPIQPVFANAGGTGGGDFSSTCPAGTVAVGLVGQSASSYVYQVRTVCAPMPVLNTATTPDSWSLARGQGLYYANNVGSTTSTAYDRQCPAGQYVIGINAYVASSRVARMNAICGTFSLSGGVVSRTQTGNTTDTNSGSGTTNTMVCPGNGVVTAIRGKNGTWLDSVAIQCTQVTPTCDATPSFGYDAFALSGINQFLGDYSSRAYTARVPYCGQVQQFFTSLGFSPAHTYSSDLITSLQNVTWGGTYTLWSSAFTNQLWSTRTESWILNVATPGAATPASATWVFNVTDNGTGDTGTIQTLNVNFLCRP